MKRDVFTSSGIVIAEEDRQNARSLTNSPDANSPPSSANERVLTARSVSRHVWPPDGRGERVFAPLHEAR